MPHSVRKTKGKKTKPYAIVNKKTGKTGGRSTSRSKAQKSARIRDRASGH